MNREEALKLIKAGRAACADLRDVNLHGAILRGAILRSAYLSDADLSGAYLSGADLRGTNLHDANLQRAILLDADLQRADLRDANLHGADLSGADLHCADLRDADLRDANLCGANLSGADLRGADLCGVRANSRTLGYWPVLPMEGSYFGWKKCVGGVLVQLLVPGWAKRSSATTRKCRASSAIVVEIEGGFDSVRSTHCQAFVYTKGKEVFADHWDEDRWNECSGGIHHFLTREEAEEW